MKTNKPNRSPTLRLLTVSSETQNQAQTPDTPFPIVGIGASAGGLEAATDLLHALPADSGMAFVLVQHLDPHHKSILADLLSKATTMSVREAEDGMHVEPNSSYIIPPNMEKVPPGLGSISAGAPVNAAKSFELRSAA